MKRPAIMTVDLEDYRQHERERITGIKGQPYAREVDHQTELLLDAFESRGIAATFFTVGELAPRLSPAVWKRLARLHRVGCHGHRHRHVSMLGSEAFRDDVATGKAVLEDALGAEVVSYRAPYFSADGCDPWFGEGLAATGFRIDSSRRMPRLPGGGGTLALPGAGETVLEVPLMSVGVGGKRLTVIGGTYFRLLPMPAIIRLLNRASARGFVPMVYLHPYDIDAAAEPLRFAGLGVRGRVGDQMRRAGRTSVADKLDALCRAFHFSPIENLL